MVPSSERQEGAGSDNPLGWDPGGTRAEAAALEGEGKSGQPAALEPSLAPAVDEAPCAVEPAAPEPVAARLERLLRLPALKRLGLGTAAERSNGAGRPTQAVTDVPSTAVVETPPDAVRQASRRTAPGTLEAPSATLRGPESAIPARSSVPRLGREERGTAPGRWSLGTVSLPPDHLHGRILTRRLLDVVARSAVVLGGDPGLLDFDPRGALFFDLETTGLLGGRGEGAGQGPTGRPFAFVIGLLRVDGEGAIHIRQHLLSDPHDEPQVLGVLAEELADATTLVSYNGRAFDRHLLAERYALARLDDPGWLTKPHLDLLHPARRLARDSLPSCSLGNLERAWLGVRRVGDLPGSDVPVAYSMWRRTGQWFWVEPVLDHNVVDLLSLATLCVHLHDAVRAPPGAGEDGRSEDPPITDDRALIAAARLLLHRGDPGAAAAHLEDLMRREVPDDVRYGALRLLADVEARRGETEALRAVLESMVERAEGHDPWPWRRLSILLERDVGDPEAALRLCERWFAVLGPGPVAALDRPEVERRLARLRKRLGRTQDGGERGDP